MHDLNTIIRRNQEALETARKHQQAQGRWVLCRYEGAHLVSIETFPSGQAAQAAALETPARGLQGESLIIHAPLPDHQVVGRRDQSEDRPQPGTRNPYDDRPAPAPDVTLGDYIARKSALLDNSNL